MRDDMYSASLPGRAGHSVHSCQDSLVLRHVCVIRVLNYSQMLAQFSGVLELPPHLKLSAISMWKFFRVFFFYACVHVFVCMNVCRHGQMFMWMLRVHMHVETQVNIGCLPSSLVMWQGISLSWQILAGRASQLALGLLCLCLLSSLVTGCHYICLTSVWVLGVRTLVLHNKGFILNCPPFSFCHDPADT